mmetsp:Transcript_86517/g.239903  ORF Transcript_86517/g.239903 Transcript_86517/m.239903 type:complete len:229 (+) Transcript_86517:237-923(+)
MQRSFFTKFRAPQGSPLAFARWQTQSFDRSSATLPSANFPPYPYSLATCWSSSRSTKEKRPQVRPRAFWIFLSGFRGSICSPDLPKSWSMTKSRPKLPLESEELLSLLLLLLLLGFFFFCFFFFFAFLPSLSCASFLASFLTFLASFFARFFSFLARFLAFFCSFFSFFVNFRSSFEACASVPAAPPTRLPPAPLLAPPRARSSSSAPSLRGPLRERQRSPAAMAPRQ